MSRRPVASVSLDADNLWSYLKTHGDPAWEARPSYLPALGPRVRDLYGRHGITGTVFMVGHDVTRDDGRQMVADLAADGHEIGNHSFEHEPWLHRYSRDQLEAELARTEEAVVEAGAPRPRGFRGPGFSLSPELLDLLQERDYAYDCTTLPTWIGPLARRYYFKASDLDAEDLQQREALFGSASEGLRPVGPYRWDTAPGTRALVELPVTTMPVARIPIHASYVLHVHSIDPRLAKAFVRSAVIAMRVRRTAPSLLLHPLDLLGREDAPGLEFFPGMSLPAAEKVRVVDDLLEALGRHWQLGTTRAHADAVATQPLARHPSGSAGPQGIRERLRLMRARDGRR